MRDILRQSSVSFATRVVGLAAAFASNILLSRLMGPAGYGNYAIALGWAMLLAIPARLGLDNVALRFVTIYRDERRAGPLRGLLRSSFGAILLVSLLGAMLALGAATALGPARVDPLIAAAVGLLVLPLAAMGWLSAVLRAFTRIFSAQAYEQLVRPLLLIALVGLAWLAGRRIDAPLALGLTFAALLAPLLLQAWHVRRDVAALGEARPDYAARRQWLSVSWPLFLLSLFQEASNQVDLLLLGAIRGASEAAHFAAAARLSSLASFGLIAIATVSAPAIAAAFHRSDKPALARLATLNARIALGFAALLVAALAAIGKVALAAFGPSFPVAYPVLLIFLGGALLNAFTGNVANFLLMTGHERVAAAFMATALAVAAAVDVLLIPRLGAIGAALGAVSGLVVWNLAMLVHVRRVIGIDASALGAHPKRSAGEQPL